MDPKTDFAENINRTCSCKTLKPEVIQGLYQEIQATRPNLFSSTMVFISEKNLNEMKQLITVIEDVIHSDFYQKKVLSNVSDIALKNFGPSGVFMGYDFHLNNDGPKLIEINTNAGGGLLNAELAQAQKDCCIDIEFSKEKIEKEFIEMFQRDWKLQNPEGELKTIAIVDESPAEQYLYPEFRLFKTLFEKHGYDCVISSPEELSFQDGKLKHQDMVIDLVYNRLTDFYLHDEKFEHLKNAYMSGAAAFTPNPHHHALYANKLNLQLLTDDQFLNQLDEKKKSILKKSIPRTEILDPSREEDFWNRRKNLFFKPAHGFGSKASYRGDKITRKVWEEILKSSYVAQEIIPPGNRIVDVDGSNVDLKLDLRAYVYNGKIQLLAARLYSGQTTNFRTAGGGFAPVFITP